MAPTTRPQARPPATPTRRLSSANDPPTYRVDLSAPPEKRYREICSDFKPYLADIVPIYDDLLELTTAPRLLNFLAKSLLRRVYSAEETREIRGISKLTGVPLHLVVAFNTFLDLFSGCSSGGARVTDAGSGHESGVVHFRGLDWEMEPLRKLTICVDYVRKGQIVARHLRRLHWCINGSAVGPLIVVELPPPNRLSVVRLVPQAAPDRPAAGFRPSIPSILRRILLSPSPPPSLADLARDLPRKASTPCYLTFCTPAGILVLEKDLTSAVAQTSDDFLAVTNHDVHMEQLAPEGWRALLQQEGAGHDALVDDSIERKQCVCKMWAKQGARLKVEDVVHQMEVRPVLNECTHFSCVMDPAVAGGGLLWVKAYEEPVEMEDDRIDVSSMESD